MKLVLPVALLFFFPCLGFSQDTTNGIIWYPAVLLSDTTINAAIPKVDVTGDDMIHVTWEGSSGFLYPDAERWPYSRSTDGGVTFTRIDIYPDTPSIPFMYWNQIVTRDQAVFNFARLANGNSIYMRRSSDAGASWDSLVVISDSAGVIHSAAASGDTLVLAHTRSTWKRILRSADNGNTWTDADESLDYSAKASLSPGLLHLAQTSYSGSSIEIEYRRSTDLGNTWQQTTILSTIDQYNSADPVTTTYEQAGKVVIVAAWRDSKYGQGGFVGGSILARFGIVGIDSTTWFPEQVLTQIPYGYLPALSASNGRFAAAWMMDRETSPLSQVRVSNDTSWAPSFDPSGGHTVAVTGIDVAISKNAVHVVWEAKQARKPDYYVVFYRRGVFQTTEVSLEDRTSPDLVRLEQNYPNPFNPATTISYSIPKRGKVSLKVYDLIGREVAELVNEEKSPGTHNVKWETGNFAGGVYFYRLSTDGITVTKKAILLK